MKFNPSPIRETMQRRGWTRTHFAVVCGIDPSCFNRAMERQTISLHNAKDMADAAGLKLMDIISLPETISSGHAPRGSSVRIDRERLLNYIAEKYGEVVPFAEAMGISYATVYKMLKYGYTSKSIYLLLEMKIGEFADG